MGHQVKLYFHSEIDFAIILDYNQIILNLDFKAHKIKISRLFAMLEIAYSFIFGNFIGYNHLDYLICYIQIDFAVLEVTDIIFTFLNLYLNLSF